MPKKKDLKVVALRDLSAEDNVNIKFVQHRYHEKSASKAILQGISRIKGLEQENTKLRDSGIRQGSQIVDLQAQIDRYMSAANIQEEMLLKWRINAKE